MKIAIRADGGNNIGMGHIMRTLVLAKELSKTNDVFYICRIDKQFSNKYKSGIEMVKSKGFKVITINDNNFIEELCKIKTECLITDSYDVNEEYFNQTKKFFKVTGYIDDMNLYYFNVDFVINQNIGAEKLVYKPNKETKFFLGTNYIMLREEFRNVKFRNVNEKVSDVMITVGGGDTIGLTNIICDYVKDLDLNFHVVIGPSFEKKNIEKLIYINKEKENIKLYFNANMIEIMNNCDIAISACGSTLYELAVCNVPTIGIIIAENQERIACEMDEEGLIYNLGWYDSLNEDDIKNKIRKISDLNNRLSIINKQSIINKDGVKKIATIIENFK